MAEQDIVERLRRMDHMSGDTSDTKKKWRICRRCGRQWECHIDLRNGHVLISWEGGCETPHKCCRELFGCDLPRETVEDAEKDIVERLEREVAEHYGFTHPMDENERASVKDDSRMIAAAEIARLRAALEKAKEKLELYRIKNSGKYVGGMEYGALMNLINDLLGKRDECKHDFQVCLLPEGGAMGQCRKCGVIQKTDRSFPILGID